MPCVICEREQGLRGINTVWRAVSPPGLSRVGVVGSFYLPRLRRSADLGWYVPCVAARHRIFQKSCHRTFKRARGRREV